MKARIKATGEIVEVEFTERKTHTDEDVYITQEGCLIEESRLDFNIETIDYWTRHEHQYAGMAMQGLLSGKWVEMMYAAVGNDGQYRDLLTNKAKEFAHALVQKMKEERK